MFEQGAISIEVNATVEQVMNILLALKMRQQIVNFDLLANSVGNYTPHPGSTLLFGVEIVPMFFVQLTVTVSGEETGAVFQLIHIFATAFDRAVKSFVPVKRSRRVTRGRLLPEERNETTRFLESGSSKDAAQTSPR